MKVVVYTVIIGGYDKLRDHVDLPYDFIAYIDDKSIIPANTNWQIRDIPEEYTHTNMSAKKLSTSLKMIPHKLFPEYDISVYIDGKISINKNIQTLLDSDYDNRLLTNKHPERQCTYDEINILRCYKWENATVLNDIERFLKEEHFPKNYGMVDMCLIIQRHNDPYVIEIMNETLELMNKYNITRQQLVFNYVLWKQNKTVSTIPYDVRGKYTSNYFTQYPHCKSHYNFTK